MMINHSRVIGGFHEGYGFHEVNVLFHEGEWVSQEGMNFTRGISFTRGIGFTMK